MPKSTPEERAYARWYAEKHPEKLRSALRDVALLVRDMDPRLRELISEELEKDRMAAAELAEDDNGPLSKPDTPKRWGLIFNCSARTFVRRVKAKTIPAHKYSDKSYAVRLDYLPSDHK